jgi:hypothetical protein
MNAENYGYDVNMIATETIQLDYLALSGNQYLINDDNISLHIC